VDLCPFIDKETFFQFLNQGLYKFDCFFVVAIPQLTVILYKPSDGVQHVHFADVLELHHQSLYALEFCEFAASCCKALFVDSAVKQIAELKLGIAAMFAPVAFH
jgi:hypothetical protein